MSYKYDKNKPIRTDWENLKIGDYVFDDVRGPATFLKIDNYDKTI